MTQQDTTFRTSDTTLATFLITKNFPLLRIDYTQPRFEHHFPLSEEIQELANRCLSGNALTDPMAFNRINRKLLRIIHQRIQWGDD